MHLSLKTFIRRVVLFSFLIVACTTTSLLLARGSSKYLNAKFKRLKHPRNPTSSSNQASEDYVSWVIFPPILAVFICNRWRKFKGYWWPDPYRYYTCPPEDHELTVADRRAIMVITLIFVTAINMFCWSWDYYLRTTGLAILVTLLYLGLECRSVRSEDHRLATTDFVSRLWGIIVIFFIALDMMYCGLSWKDCLLEKIIEVVPLVILWYFLSLPFK